jgi:hypothetical protein
MELGPEKTDAPAVETEIAGFTARRTDNTLVVTYEERERATIGGQAFNQHSRRLDVYVKQDGRWRLKAMSAVRMPEAPAVVAVDPAMLRDYAGEFEFAPGVVSVVGVEGDHLVEQSTGNPQVKLLPVGPDVFFDPDDVVARVEFARDAEGRVTEQVYRSGSQVLRAKRVK